MKPISWAERLRYRVDNAIAKGPSVLLLWLVASVLLLVVLAALLTAIGRYAPIPDGGTQPGFWPLLWTSFIHFLDNGNFSGDNTDWGARYIATMGFVTLTGIGFTAFLTGILTTTLAARLEAMRKGRSRVAVEGHTVILGWSPHVFTTVAELLEAGRNHPGRTVALLAPKDKVEMEDSLRARVGSSHRTHLVCRSGLPMDLTDLSIANPFAAKAVIVLAPATEDSPADPDAEVIKTVLALCNYPGRPPGKLYIVAELRDRHNLEAARLAGGEETQFVLADEVIARMTAQTCRQSGLSVVLSELLSFQGNEIYFVDLPELVGKTFAEALFWVETSVPIGIRRANGQILLAPKGETVLQSGDHLIVIAEDDDTTRLSSSLPTPDQTAWVVPQPKPAAPEHTLILGWNGRGPIVAQELERMVAPGSSLTVLVGEEQAPEVEGLAAGMRSRLEVKIGDPTDRRTLEALNLARFQHVITLGDSSLGSGAAGIQAADAHTLVTLLHLRHINAGLATPFAVVSEMLDPRNRELAEVARADDFIVSDRLVSLVVTQIAENPELSEVWGELLDAEGVTIYLRPIAEYVRLETGVSFYTVLQAALQRGEIAIGYRLAAHADDKAHNYGVRVNPNKAERLSFAPGDKVIVLGDVDG